MQKPTPVPDLGFYYHYKHEAGGDLYNYAYEVVGVGAHTEEENSFFVVYRPLYKSASVFQAGKLFDIRPLPMWMSTVEHLGVTKPRFARITSPDVIAELEKMRNEMYG